MTTVPHLFHTSPAIFFMTMMGVVVLTTWLTIKGEQRADKRGR